MIILMLLLGTTLWASDDLPIADLSIADLSSGPIPVSTIPVVDITIPMSRDSIPTDEELQEHTINTMRALHNDGDSAEIADTILQSFFCGNNERARERLRVVLAERVRAEDESVRRVLIETYSRGPQTPSLGDDTSQEVSQKVFDLLTNSIEDAMDEETKTTEYWERKAKERCKKFTVAMFSGFLGLAGAAMGAAITAGVENAGGDC